MDLYEIEAISKERNKERKEEGLTFSPKACSPFRWLLPSGRWVSFWARYVRHGAGQSLFVQLLTTVAEEGQLGRWGWADVFPS